MISLVTTYILLICKLFTLNFSRQNKIICREHFISKNTEKLAEYTLEHSSPTESAILHS